MSFLGPNLLLFFKALLVPKKPQSSPWNNKEVMNSEEHGMDSFQHRHIPSIDQSCSEIFHTSGADLQIGSSPAH